MAAGQVTPIKSLQDSAVNMEYSIIPVTPTGCAFALRVWLPHFSLSLTSLEVPQEPCSISVYTTKFLVCVCECWTDVTSPCLHRSYSCGTVSPACKAGSGPLHVYIAPIHAVWYTTPSGSALRPQAALNQSY